LSRRALRQIAERRGWEVVEQYSDAGISGSKGRDGRPGLDSMLKDASKRRFDVVMAWAIDRLGAWPATSSRTAICAPRLNTTTGRKGLKQVGLIEA
jgi:DNA invertase Pin-like site-specific DNA recombinase